MISKQKSPVSVIPLETPDLSQSNFLAQVEKIQTFRKGGLRIQHEQIGGKHIFHNYGHGGTGIALTYGSAFMSAKSFYTHVNVDKSYDCAIIGSGIIGLLTALQLVRYGHYPVIYDDHFQVYTRQGQKELSWQIDEGIWLPLGHNQTDRLKYELISKISYEYYEECLKKSRYQSFKLSPIYVKQQTIQQLREKIPGFIYNSYKPVFVNYNNGNSHEPHIKFNTIKIDPELYAEELRMECVLRGVKFIQKQISNIQDILQLNEDIVFNCNGNNQEAINRNIFKDQNMYSKKTNLMIFKNTKKLDYTIEKPIKNRLNLRMHCFGDKIILRAQSLHANQSDKFSSINLVNQMKNVFQQRKIKPKL